MNMSNISLSYRAYSLDKKVPLKISRGVASASISFIVELESGGVVGLGEAAEFVIPNCQNLQSQIEADLQRVCPVLSKYSPFQRATVEAVLIAEGVCNSVRAAIDMALYDWMGKFTGLPVWRLLGLDAQPRGPISATIGINTPEGAVERLRKWQELGPIRAVKIKLGSPEGLEADKAMMLAVMEAANDMRYVGVDANCGWSLDNSVAMSHWLRDLGVAHIEQPMAVENNSLLPQLHSASALPIFLDESCCSAQDAIRLAPYIDGFNIKISKVGGLSEALRMIAVAQALGLKTIVGCYSNTALGNGAAHQLASLIDYIDLDSHLNLRNDPTLGQPFSDGFLVNQDIPGLGVRYA